MKKTVLAVMALVMVVMPQAQSQAGDSVVINVGNGSKVIISIKDRKDLETLKHYNFQALVDDMISKLEKEDTTSLKKPSAAYLKDSTRTGTVGADSSEPPKEEKWVLDSYEKDKENDTDNNNDDWDFHSGNRSRGRTQHSVNFDLGTNNYLSAGKFPDGGNDLHTVRPWGSWYVGMNSIQRTRVVGILFLEWGAGLSWYNFKFQDENVRIDKDSTMVAFSLDTRPVDFQKSKLTAFYVQAHMVPVLDFGRNRRKPMFFDGRGADSFRLGFGGYAGYRLDSYSKMVYKEDGDKEKDRDHDNFYLNNFRYGVRVQLGFRDTDLFFNYDLNELFIEGKGPALNAFSFGVSF